MKFRDVTSCLIAKYKLLCSISFSLGLSPVIHAKFKILSITLGGIILTSCAGGVYSGPVTTENAKVRFSFDSFIERNSILSNPGFLNVQQYEGASCQGEKNDWVTLVHEGNLWSKPERLNMPLQPDLHENAYTEFLVDAEQEMHFLFRGGSTEYSVGAGLEDRRNFCAVPVSFTFLKGKSYDLRFYQTDRLKCHIEISEIIEKNGIFESVVTRKNENIAPGPDSECYSVFTKSDLL